MWLHIYSFLAVSLARIKGLKMLLSQKIYLFLILGNFRGGCGKNYA